jgi:hypothetical protein
MNTIEVIKYSLGLYLLQFKTSLKPLYPYAEAIAHIVALAFFLAVLAVYWPSNFIFQFLTMAKDAAEEQLNKFEGVS